MKNASRNTTAVLLKDILSEKFGDIQWCIGYPDGSYAIGLKTISVDACNQRGLEVFSRAKARARSQVMRDMGFQIIEAGYMKPRNVAKSGPVVVFRIPQEGVVLE